MDSEGKEKTDAEIQQEMIEWFDTEASRVINSYLEENPGHDISDHEAFTLVGISYFFQFWHYHKLELPPGLYDKVVRMYMKLDPPDYAFLKTFKDELLKSQRN